MASVTSPGVESDVLRGRSAGYSGYQIYLLRRLADLERRYQELLPSYLDHPLGRLAAAARQATLVECEWAGLSREAGWILRRSRGSVSA